MKPHFAFKFANSSTALRDIHEVRFQAQHTPLGPRQGKPIHAFFTQGMQIVGVPPQLIHRVGAQAIASLNGGVHFGDVGKPAGSLQATQADRRNRLITSVHMETADAIYLLRIDNQIYMAMPQ
jgi:hypothetical protein